MPAEPIMTLADDLDPWEQQPEEKDDRFSLFAVYRDLGRGRRITAACQIVNDTNRRISRTRMHEIAKVCRWDERARAYDRSIAEADSHELIAERREMCKKYRSLATDLYEKGLEALHNLEPEDLNASDVVRVLTLAAKLHADALGVPEKLALTGADGMSPVAVEDVSGMTAPERQARMMAIAAELHRRAGHDDDNDVTEA